MRKKSVIPIVIGTLAGAVSHLSAEETQVFTERFVNTSGANAAWSTVPGWSAYTNDETTNGDGLVGWNEDPWGAVPGKLGGNVSGGVGAELSFDDNDFGFLFFYKFDPGEANVLVINDTVSIDRDSQEITRIEFVMRERDSVQHNGRVAVKVADEWYVNDQLFLTDLTATVQFNFKEFTWTTENWRKVVFNPENMRELGLSAESAGALPDGDLEGVGFYLVHPGGAVSSAVLDEYSVYAAPKQVAADWYGYSVDAEGWVNTDTWMGWVNVVGDPYIWNQALSKYVYVGNDSGWVYVPQ